MHLPDVTSTGQLGDYYLNRSGMVDMPEEWKAGILLPRFGLHIANTEHGVFTDYGYLVKAATNGSASMRASQCRNNTG